MIQKAQRNAKRAGVDADITFQVADFTETPLVHSCRQDTSSTLISNPPYGERLTPEEIMPIYQALYTTFQNPAVQ